MSGPRVVVIGTLWERLVAFIWPAPTAQFEFVRVRDVSADLMALRPEDGPLTAIFNHAASFNLTGVVS